MEFWPFYFFGLIVNFVINLSLQLNNFVSLNPDSLRSKAELQDMGRKRVVDAPVISLKDYCGICNSKFSKNNRKTRKFVINVSAAAAEVGSSSGSAAAPTENQTVDVHLAMEEILTWRNDSILPLMVVI